MLYERGKQRIQAQLEQLRLALARPDALMQLSLLGALCGAFSGLVIIALRLSIETGTELLGLESEDAFEQLTPTMRLLLATLGGLLVGALFRWVGDPHRQVGMVHVAERLVYHQARLPWVNAVLQFIGATLCLACGHSLGREGPAVHLGAASGSLLGQALGLPNNSTRWLVGAGCAGAIAAAFNTPLAGVIFAMEVILMESSLLGVMPIVVAAVTATAATRLVFGDAPAFLIPPLHAGHLSELPFVLGLGVLSGLAAVVFIELVQRVEKMGRQANLVLRFGAAGALTGLIAIPVPQVMGIGYDTVNLTLLGEIGAFTLIAVALAKLLATGICIGLGLPGGLIGPTLVIGAAIGGAAGIFGGMLIPSHASSPGYYAILGMGATMAATLQAPLAALAAILELTYNPAIVLPGMLAIVSANLLARIRFNKESVFLVLMRARGLDYRQTSMETALAGIGVSSVADRNFLRIPRTSSLGAATEALQKRPRWLLIESKDTAPIVMPAADLAMHCETLPQDEAGEMDLLSIPGRRYETATISIRASLLEAHTLLHGSAKDVILIENGAYRAGGFFGLLTRQMLVDAYLPIRPQV